MSFARCASRVTMACACVLSYMYCISGGRCFYEILYSQCCLYRSLKFALCLLCGGVISRTSKMASPRRRRQKVSGRSGEKTDHTGHQSGFSFSLIEQSYLSAGSKTAKRRCPPHCPPSHRGDTVERKRSGRPFSFPGLPFKSRWRQRLRRLAVRLPSGPGPNEESA